MFIHLPKYADNVREIINKSFFTNNSVFTDNEKDKGMLERVVSESVMCMFHLEKWTKDGKKIAKYLNNNASYEEFEELENNISCLENIITDDLKDIFNGKDSFIWLTLFNKFTKLGLDGAKFAEFLAEFKAGLRNKEVDGQLFDTVDQSGSTKDKAIIIAKLHILETLMNEFLLINKEDLEEVDTLEFVKENVNPETTEDDVEFYSDMLDDLTLEVDNNTKLLDKHNRPSLVALIGYACENDIDLDDWIKSYFATNVNYILNQRDNYLHMISTLKKGAIG
jgi:hypothetical protein